METLEKEETHLFEKTSKPQAVDLGGPLDLSLSVEQRPRGESRRLSAQTTSPHKTLSVQ